MGRADKSTIQHHHQAGFESQETIDDKLPDDDQDLYAPPPDYNAVEKIGSSQVPAEQPQAFPPPRQAESPQAFPPSRQDDHHQPHAFPPTQPDDVQSFPPPQQQPSNFVPHQSSMPGGVQIAQPAAVVINTTPFIQVQNQLPTQPWKTQLFDCMNDPQNAIITAFFPCVTFGQIAEILDSGNTSCGTSGMLYGLIACIAMPCIMSCAYRSKMRSRFGLVESPAPDWIVHCFCEWCALCQEYRELQQRGFDPTIGWLGNEAQQRQQIVMTAAPMQQRMM